MNALCVIKTSIFTLLLVTGLLLLTPIKALSMTNPFLNIRLQS
ncbi:hypothetical protein GLIP_1240 [Aliiglaciecola lipolytica E3]|uniref:Uncharacterized protein n=1 Tax=Aliiglaciecola lipolytica E3 TaxID=1127673 RepID=K6XQD2_9ALTE|nr:hypothetical protein GLIP_1240 [Aliiglaciecola lipolytica E3]